MEKDIQELKELMLRTLDSVQSLHVKVDRLEERVTALENRVAALEERVTALENRVTVLEERVTALEDSQEKRFETLITEFSASMDGMNWLKENKVDKSALRQAAV